jgi:hypothetical protein
MRETATGLGPQAEFRVGTFKETGPADSSFAAVVTSDAFLYTPDKAAAFVSWPGSCDREGAWA